MHDQGGKFLEVMQIRANFERTSVIPGVYVFVDLRTVSLKLFTISTSFDDRFKENSDFVRLDLCIGDPEKGNLNYYNNNF